MIKVCILILVSIGAISAFPDFYFFSRSAPSVAIKVNNGLNGVNGFDRSKETKFIIHGFGDNYKGVRIVKAKDGLIRNTDANIIIVDWEKGAAMPWYWYAVDNTRIVGQKLAEFIVANDLDASKVHCIGHSLGAHTCGFAGKAHKIARITGLDPAGPWFKGNPPKERLDKNDADFVDCIHTDNMLGIQDAICQKDYYPNGGGTQAGCGITSFLNIFGRKRSTEHTIEEATASIQNEDDDTKAFYKIYFGPRLFGIDFAEVTACSHLRVMHFFEESTNDKCLFSSTPCDNWSDYKKGKCVCDSTHGCPPMGYYADRNTQFGKFFLYTNSRSLFCQN